MTEKWKLDEKTGRWAMLGGCILGGGGGGSEADGKRLLEKLEELPELYLTPLAELDPDSVVLSVSLVGAPAAKEQFISPEQMIRAVELFRQMDPELRLGGIITNENGWCATVNGWVQAAATGLPLLDASCNGRAHPTGVMGSMNLHRDASYVTIMTCAGGDPDRGRYVECAVRGSVSRAAPLIRAASVAAGGVVGVARNPVSAGYVAKNGAVGSISQAIELGRRYETGLLHSAEAAIRAAEEFLHGSVVCRGTVESLTLQTQHGFDVGRCVVDGMELTFWNEYITLTSPDGTRLATFPDLIMTIGAETGRPLTSAELREGTEVFVLRTGYRNLKLSPALFDREILLPVQTAVDREILQHLDFLPENAQENRGEKHPYRND